MIIYGHFLLVSSELSEPGIGLHASAQVQRLFMIFAEYALINKTHLEVLDQIRVPYPRSYLFFHFHFMRNSKLIIVQVYGLVDWPTKPKQFEHYDPPMLLLLSSYVFVSVNYAISGGYRCGLLL